MINEKITPESDSGSMALLSYEKEVPETVKEAAEEYFIQRENKKEEKIIKFSGR